MGVTLVLSRACTLCETLLKEFPDAEPVFVEDNVPKFEKLGLLAVPAVIYDDQTIRYGEDNYRAVVEDDITF